MTEIHVQVEPTGGYASHANGRSENSIKLVSRVGQCLLFGGGRDPTFWCFALIHACLLLGLRTRSNGITSHEKLFGTKPSIARLVVWNSRAYNVDRRSTRNRPDSHTRKGYFLGYVGSMHLIMYLSDAGRMLVARHHQIDELQTDIPMDKHSSYAQFLGNYDLMDNQHKDRLKEDISKLVPDPSPWLDSKTLNVVIPSIFPADAVGLKYDYNQEYGRCKITHALPDTPAARYLRRSLVVGTYLLLCSQWTKCENSRRG